MIQIAQYVQNISRMVLCKDGDAFFVTFDDFVDLQESPAYFIEGERSETGLRFNEIFEKWPQSIALNHLTHVDRCYLSRILTKQEKLGPQIWDGGGDVP